MEESTAATGELGGGEQLAPTVDGSTMVGAARSSAANAGDANAAPESGVVKPVMLEEQTAPPEASQSVVGPAVRQQNPLVVPPAMAEGDGAEEIECEESRP